MVQFRVITCDSWLRKWETVLTKRKQSAVLLLHYTIRCFCCIGPTVPSVRSWFDELFTVCECFFATQTVDSPFHLAMVGMSTRCCSILVWVWLYGRGVWVWLCSVSCFAMLCCVWSDSPRESHWHTGIGYHRSPSVLLQRVQSVQVCVYWPSWQTIVLLITVIYMSALLAYISLNIIYLTVCLSIGSVWHVVPRCVQNCGRQQLH